MYESDAPIMVLHKKYVPNFSYFDMNNQFFQTILIISEISVQNIYLNRFYDLNNQR